MVTHKTFTSNSLTAGKIVGTIDHTRNGYIVKIIWTQANAKRACWNPGGRDYPLPRGFANYIQANTWMLEKIENIKAMSAN